MFFPSVVYIKFFITICQLISKTLYINDKTVKKEIAGTGLGLYIAKEIIKAHQGEIWAESEGMGTGSKFLVRLKKEL